ncbi:hypothetical protein PROFUN_13040 [Planoprotostelium fungivorum]|uniref:Protein transport protein SEC23 n=1 Tax=Planoprotostelium fungivorum TaxID=1890364 RepID=A0A2P6N5N0_9EUKA|nr:hypothetical protein PROFUN_13040 [Planoprotostelium fungivorum]
MEYHFEAVSNGRPPPSGGIDLYIPPSLQHFSENPDHPSYVPPQSRALFFSSTKVPNTNDTLSKMNIPFGVIFTPAEHLEPAPPCLRRPPVKCKSCGIIINFLSKLRPDGTWNCTFCDSRNESSREYGDSDAVHYPELHRSLVEYLDPTTQPSVMSSDLECIDYYLIDLNFSAQDLNTIVSSIAAAVRDTPFADATVFPGIQPVSSAEMSTISFQVNDYVVPKNECVETTLSIALDAIRETALRRRSPSGLRCMGTAVETCLSIHEMIQQRNQSVQLHGRVTLFISGHPNFGPGSLPSILDDSREGRRYFLEQADEYYRKLTITASDMDLAIDIICGDMGVPMLNRLCLGTGGTILLQREMEEQQLKKNLVKGIHRVVGIRGVVDVMCNRGLRLTHVIGPSSASQIQPEQENDSPYRITIPLSSVQPRTSLTLLYDIESDLHRDNIDFQFSVSFTNSHNQRVLRVVTHRVPTTGSEEQYIASIDGDITAVMISKMMCAQARKQIDHRNNTAAVEQSVVKILRGCGKVSRRGGYVLPTHLSLLPKRLFMLQRGPLLGPILQHMDDIDYMRCLLIQANLQDSLRMIDPPLFMVDSSLRGEQPLELYPLPTEDLAMQSDKILLLDHHTEVFRWLGGMVGRIHQTADLEGILKRCDEYVESISRHRYPHPSSHSFKEGTSMARWIQCRLIPSHKDTTEEQLENFPQMDELTEEDRRRLLSKFHRTDDLSYLQWFKKLNAT